MTGLTESEEEYLEALYRLGGNKRQVRVKELAEQLDVKEPSVVEMLRKLEDRDFVDYERYAGASLTREGEEVGMRVTRRHRLSERLLCDVLDRDLPEVHEEACKLEHSIADETAEGIARVLGNPNTCPHGRPIPEEKAEEGVDHDMDPDIIKLSEGEEGEEYRVITIPEERDAIRRLLPLCILPETEIELAEKPSIGALMIRKNGDKLALSRDIASKITVKPHGKRRRRRHRDRTGG